MGSVRLVQNDLGACVDCQSEYVVLEEEELKVELSILEGCAIGDVIVATG